MIAYESTLNDEQFLTCSSQQFKFYDDTEHRAPLDEDEQEVVPVDLLRAHMDPFYRECRAYGRLIEKQMNGKVAARCHGYLTISAGKEEELRQNFRVDIWDRPDSEYLKPVSRREPFRAIVKDLISEEIGFTQKIVGKMRRDLKKIRSVGVYPMDIHARNYKQGLLLDFSLAMTEPHYLFAIMPRWRVEEFKLDDLLAFDSMIKDEGVVTWERALPNSEYCKKLRPRKSKN